MSVTAFPSGPFATNAYVIACPETRQAAIIDPAPESAQAIHAYLTHNLLKPDKILITHSHWDHIADAAILQAQYEVPIYIHSDDRGNLEHPGSDGLPCWIDWQGIEPDYLLQEGQEIPVGNLWLKVIFTPGHTPGGVCFYCPQGHFLLSGDTLFKGTIGNLSFPTARPELMWNSLKKLTKLPADTIVYPGHGPSTTIGAESWLSNAESIFGD